MDKEPETILQQSEETAATEGQLLATIAETYASTGQDQESLPQTARELRPSFLGVPGSIPKLVFDATNSTFEPYRSLRNPTAQKQTSARCHSGPIPQPFCH
jgi:hypothetical protein